MLQRRRTDIKANNATIRRLMNPYNKPRSSSYARSDGVRQRNKNKIQLVILLMTLFLFILYNRHDSGEAINDSVNDEGSIRENLNNAAPNTVVLHDHPDGGEVVTDSINDEGSIRANQNNAAPKIVTVRSNLSNNWPSAINKIREEFYTRYGGKEEAMAMLERGVKTAADTEDHAVQHTAERILRAVLKEGDNDDKNGKESETKKNKFTMSFGGYSVTVGRGNYFHQSYPFVMQNILKPLFEDLLNLELVVRNSAIGGIPSFPYGWCLPNFLGDDSDVISWDYGMNEGNGAEAFEAYLRQGVRNLSKRPMMIMLDNKRQRVDLLKAYYKNSVLTDSIAVGRGEVVKKLLEKDEKDRPVGLQNWDKWGAPPGSPGQSKWHPKYMEHELIGWMIAMHFIDAVEAALVMLESVEKDSSIASLGIKDEDHERLVLLPEPVTGIPKGIPEAAITHILHGTKVKDNTKSKDDALLWHMDPVSCRSNFLPNIDGHMSEIIVSGKAEETGDDLTEKTDEQYQSGWVIDVGKVERETKLKVAKVGTNGLGYIDMKLALYGIPESGTLKLSLPYEGSVHGHEHDLESDMKASHWFEALVFCEVNEKRGAKECNTEEDLTFIVGGVKSSSVTKITSVASYLKKNICVNVEIPKDAIVSKDTGLLHPKHDTVELSVEISVTGEHVTRKDGACSISHVVWQSN